MFAPQVHPLAVAMMWRRAVKNVIVVFLLWVLILTTFTKNNRDNHIIRKGKVGALLPESQVMVGMLHPIVLPGAESKN
ncbi:hypothetical protein B4900_14085 [Yersinia rohdei]|nr:hypothetical protein B4900_14085 [Yersinia rohdei]